MIIKVLGPGCNNCKNLERVTREAVDDLGIDATIEKVTDYPTIAGYGVMSTPALVVDEKLVLSGRVPTAAAPSRTAHAADRLSRPPRSGQREQPQQASCGLSPVLPGDRECCRNVEVVQQGRRDRVGG